MSFHSGKINAKTVLHVLPGAQAAAKPSPPQIQPPNDLLPVLIVLHQETSCPGRVGNALRALGHRLDIRPPRFGDSLPETRDGPTRAVIFGGPMSPNDSYAFVRQGIDWI